MKVLGLANPMFHGVQIATKAVSTDFCTAGHVTPGVAQAIGKQIVDFNPDVLIVGGWSKGYDVILAAANERPRKFPVVNVFHGTMFHGSYFGGEQYLQEIDAAYRARHLDFKAYVHYPSAEYEREQRKNQALWLPHYFPMAKKVQRKPKFKIGLLGGTNSWYKNAEGPLQVAKDFASTVENVEVISSPAYDRSREKFLELLDTCSVLIHTSHIECYSNTIQEAWARGVPVITSRACRGLTNSPLMSALENEALRGLEVGDAIDPNAIWGALVSAYTAWDSHSQHVHDLYAKLSKRARSYTTDVLTTMVQAWREKKPISAHRVFDLPFKHRKDLWI